MKALHFSPEITDDFVRTHEQYLTPAVFAPWAGPFAEIANRVAAIREMRRVCKPGGYVVLAIGGALRKDSAYDELIRLLSKFSGAHAAMQLALHWELGKPGVMDALLVSSGVNEYECHERIGQACYLSIRAFIEARLRLAGEFDHLSERTLRR